MKAYTFVEPLEPDTISGYSFKVTTIYSSLNKDAIEALLNEFKKRYNCGKTIKYDIEGDEEVIKKGGTTT